MIIIELRGKHHDESESDRAADVPEIAHNESLLETKNLVSINAEFDKNCH